MLMKKTAVTGVGVLLAGVALGGVQLQLAEDASLDLGFSLQTQALLTERDLAADGSMNSELDFKVRRARLRVGADVTQWVSLILQTDVGSGEDGQGLDMRVIDAHVTLKPVSGVDVLFGQHMAPANRQNATGIGAFLTMDRPGVIYKSLSWGTRSMYAFSNLTIAETDAGLRGEADVRDMGATLFVRGTLRDQVHGKIYLGVYDGIQAATEDNPRLTARGQLNLLDAENGYYNAGTYIGKKRTVGVGASVDTQDAVMTSEDKGLVDYLYYSADAFAELPCGPGSVTFEAAYSTLDLGGATLGDPDGKPDTAAKDLRRAEGDGYYAQAGYLLGRWQPWAAYETWSSDAPDGAGGYDAWRVGATFYIKGANANLRAGFERLSTDAPMGKTGEDRADTFIVGAYMTY